MIRVLQNEGFPNLSTSTKIVNTDYSRNLVDIENYLKDFLTQLTLKINKVQTDLLTKDLITYEDKITRKTRVGGIIGGHHAKIFVFDRFFLKKLSAIHSVNEAYMYYLFHTRFPKLVDYLPKIYGLIYVRKGVAVTKEVVEETVKKGVSSKCDIRFFSFER